MKPAKNPAPLLALFCAGWLSLPVSAITFDAIPSAIEVPALMAKIHRFELIEKPVLFGNVASVEEFRDTHEALEERYTFSPSGLLLTYQKRTESLLQQASPALIEHREYRYDGRRIVTVTSQNGVEGALNPPRTHTLTYDPEGWLTSFCHNKAANGCTTYLYKRLDGKVEVREKGGNRFEVWNTSNGNWETQWLQKPLFNPEAGTSEMIAERLSAQYRILPNKNTLMTVFSTVNGRTKFLYRIESDIDGLMLSQTVAGTTRSPAYMSTFKYEKDTQGNWIKRSEQRVKVTVNSSGDPLSRDSSPPETFAAYRSIQYFAAQ